MLLLLLYCRAQISGRTGRRENSCRSLMVNFTLACRSSRPDPRPDPNLKPSPDTDPLGSRCSGAALQRIYFEVCMWWRCPKQEHATERPASRPTRPTTGSFFFAWRSCIRFSHCSFRLCFQLFFFFVPVSFLFIFPFFTIFFWCAGFCIFWFLPVCLLRMALHCRITLLYLICAPFWNRRQEAARDTRSRQICQGTAR